MPLRPGASAMFGLFEISRESDPAETEIFHVVFNGMS
jgi:hypothetical protein